MYVHAYVLPLLHEIAVLHKMLCIKIRIKLQKNNFYICACASVKNWFTAILTFDWGNKYKKNRITYGSCSDQGCRNCTCLSQISSHNLSFVSEKYVIQINIRNILPSPSRSQKIYRNIRISDYPNLVQNNFQVKY